MGHISDLPLAKQIIPIGSEKNTYICCQWRLAQSGFTQLNTTPPKFVGPPLFHNSIPVLTAPRPPAVRSCHTRVRGTWRFLQLYCRKTIADQGRTKLSPQCAQPSPPYLALERDCTLVSFAYCKVWLRNFLLAKVITPWKAFLHFSVPVEFRIIMFSDLCNWHTFYCLFRKCH